MSNESVKNLYNSKSQRLTESLRGDLVGVFAKESFLPPEQHLSGHYQSSRNTVRKAIENLMEDGVLVRTPNRRLRIRREVLTVPGAEQTFTLMWAFAAVQDSLICNLTDGINRYVKEHRLKLQLLSSANRHEPVLHGVEQCRRLGCDGVILFPYDLPEYRELMKQLTAMDLPVVITGAAWENIAVSSVAADNFGGVYLASQDLIRRCDAPVYYIAAADQQDGSERRRAWAKAMSDAGFGDLIESHCCDLGVSGTTPDHWPMVEKFSHPLPRVEELLGRITPPAGILCVNDYVATCVYEAAAKRGWVIGKDLKVIGFDDIPVARRMTPPLTTIRSDIRQCGYCAAQIIHRRLTGEVTGPVHLTIPTEFVSRGSD